MKEQIYRDLWGEVLERGEFVKRVFLYKDNNLDRPALILDNDAEVQKLIEFLTKVLEKKK